MTNFTDERVKRLLAGKDVVLVTLKKPGESLAANRSVWKAGSSPLYVLPEQSKIPFKSGYRLKWQVGRDYAVCQKNKSLWHCPKCNAVAKLVKVRITDKKPSAIDKACVCSMNLMRKDVLYARLGSFKPLRFVVKSIKSQRLLDVTEEQAKKAGGINMGIFGGAKEHFIGGFARKNYPKLFKKFSYKNVIDINAGKEAWKKIGNPEVWVLQVVKKC